MKLLSKTLISEQLLPIIGSLILISSNSVFADFAVLVDEGVLVEKDPQVVVIDAEEEETPTTTPLNPVGTAINASYVSVGGWAVTGSDFIDAAALVYDFGTTTSVSQATLSLPLEQVFPQNGITEIEIYVYSDNGFVEFTDYSIGFSTPIAEIDATDLTQIELDVTGAVNSALSAGRYVSFRIKSALNPDAVEEDTFPAWTGVKLIESHSLLEFTAGAPPAVAKDAARFDGFTLEVPEIAVAGIGEAAVQMRLVDPNKLHFQLTFAEVTGSSVAAPPLSGIDLFNCAAFAPPDVVDVVSGTSTYSTNSGILDIPSVNF